LHNPIQSGLLFLAALAVLVILYLRLALVVPECLVVLVVLECPVVPVALEFPVVLVVRAGLEVLDYLVVLLGPTDLAPQLMI
jgi:hypothetical protein